MSARDNKGTGWSVIADAELRALREEVARLRDIVRVIAKAELVDDDGIIDADVLFAVQQAARAALEPVR